MATTTRKKSTAKPDAATVAETTAKPAAEAAATTVAETTAKPAAEAAAEAAATTVAETTAQDPDETADEEPTDPRKEPASAQLDPPSTTAPSTPAPVNVIRDFGGQAAADMLGQAPDASRSELYDAATGKAPDPDAVFNLEFPYGSAVMCQVRLCERLWLAGQDEPIDRLVMAKGHRTDRVHAERIQAVIRAQVEAASDEPAKD